MRSSFESARPTAEVTPLRRNPGRLAWTILIGSFLVLLGLLAAIQFAISTYRAQAVVRQDVTVEVIRGTTLIRPFASASEVEASTYPQVTEGDAIRTTGSSEAILVDVRRKQRPFVAKCDPACERDEEIALRLPQR